MKDIIRRKGQVQLGETTAVIIIVIILLVIGIVFWNNVNSSDIKSMQSQSQELSVIEIANIVSELPELKCYDSGVNKYNCIDWYKVKAMSESINNTEDKSVLEYYNNYFKNSKIMIIKIYPEEGNITLYDAKLNNSSKKLINIPVNIRDYKSADGRLVKETVYGMIIVEGYYNDNG
jgi:ribosomal protein L7/L12